MLCKICLNNSISIATAKLINKFDVQYFQCEHCGFVQTEEPYWLDEVYREPITRSDIGMVGRNLWLTVITKALILSFFDLHSSFIDYGGGYGLFVRLMRDQGLDFYRYDKHCVNLFAQQFDVEVEKKTHYELLTAFELFEHLVNPLEDIESMLAFSSSILFSTVLLPLTNPKPGEWWYYGLEHGQHVSLYTQKSLECIADQHGLQLFTNRSTLHLLTPKRLSPIAFRVFSSYRIAQIISKRYRRSLQSDDFYKITGQRTGH